VCGGAQRKPEEEPSLFTVPARESRCATRGATETTRKTTMTEAEAKTLMEHHGITAAQQAVYYYKGFRYGNLMDALNYAELVTGRDDQLAAAASRR
jgi:hypothetical protein